jgi:hypothetical protein
MTDGELEEKFERLADGEMPAGRQAEVLERLWSLETETDLASLLALFAPGG